MRFDTREVSLRPGMLLALCLALGLVTGCGGNGGFVIGGNGVVATSFSGTPVAPGGAPPPHFLDEVLLITLAGSIDNALFGGFVAAPGTTDPVVLTGRSATADAIPYHPYAQQGAASQSLQILDDTTGAIFPGIIGRSATDADVLVFDPHVPAGNPLAMNPLAGFDANQQYDVFIPENSGIRINGRSVDSFGTPPPVAPPAFGEPPGPSTSFRTGTELVPDNTPPDVVTITTMSQASAGAPTSTPIPDDDVVLVRFTEPMDVATINIVANAVVRNTSVTTPDQPGGIIVPTVPTFDATLRELLLSPGTSFGPGPFTLEVTVGNTDPAAAMTDLAGNPVAGVTTATFTTIAAPGQPMTSSILEDFADTSTQDPQFDPRYNAARWDEGDSNVLASLQLTGAPDATNLGAGPGARTQVTITPMGTAPLGQPPLVAFFSPFDDDGANNLGAAVNPQGGSHLQLLYNVDSTSGELPLGLADSIELMEWAPAAGESFSGSYDGFTMRMGATSASAAFTTDAEQLGSIYDRNFSFDNPQNEFLMPLAHPDPLRTPNESPVVVTPPQPYVVQGDSAPFVPLPLPVLPFDFDHDRTEQNVANQQVHPNLVVDIGVDAGTMPSGNFWLGTNPAQPIPTRRLIGGPGGVTAFSLDAVVYHARFTIVKKNSSARTTFYDAGTGTAPVWTSLSLFPGVSQRPPGTAVTVRVGGADAVAPTPVGTTTFFTYVSRSGVINPAALQALAGKRFLRVQFELESSTFDNSPLVVDDFLLGLVP